MADPATMTRDVPALSIRAAVKPGSVDPEKRTAEVVWTTGARVKRGGLWTEPFWEELSLDPTHVRMQRINNGAPLLNAHNGYDTRSVLGVVEPGSARVDGKQGTAIVRFAKAEDDPEADKVFRKVKDGILQNVSVGYRVHQLDEVERGRDREDKTSVMRATDWEPFEISVVPMGADDGAGFRGAQGQTPNPCVFKTAQESKMADEKKPESAATAAASNPEAMAEEAARQAREASTRAAEQRATVDARQREQAMADERERQMEIRRIVARTALGDEFADKMIKDNVTVDIVRKVALDHLIAADEGSATRPHFEAGDDKRDKFLRGACAAIFQRAGTAQIITNAAKLDRFADQFRGVSVDPGEFRGMRLLDLARASLEIRGVSTRNLHGDALVIRALTYRDAAMNTTSDFATLLETAVNKTFLGQYAITPTKWRRFCSVKSVNDFRTSTFYRPGTFSKLDSVSESGEVKQKNIPDGSKATLTPSTKGNKIGISRRAIVNDDMGVFNDLAGGLGMAAALTIEAEVFALLTVGSGLGPTQTDGQPFFHTNRANIGSSGAMTVATIDASRAVMAKQKDVSGNNYLDISPVLWIGPVEIEGQARVINESTSDPTTSKSSTTPNPVRGIFRDIIGSAYLSAQSSVRHYLFADPGLYPVFAVGFIDGQEAPRIESQQVFGYDGMQMQIIMDYGTAILDYRGALTCPGQ